MVQRLVELLRAAPMEVWQSAAAGGVFVALVAVVAAVRARRAPRALRPRGRRLGTVLTVVAAGLATAASAQGMWVFFGDVFHVSGPLRVALFALFEVALVNFAVNARYTMLAAVERGERPLIGFDGLMVWVMAVITGVLSAMDADSVPGVIGRLAVALTAAVLAERDLILEVRSRIRDREMRGRLQRRWRTFVERVLVRLGVLDPRDRTAREAAASRWIAKLAAAAFRFHSVDERERSGKGGRWVSWRWSWAALRLRRVVQRAAGRVGLTTDEQLLLEARKHLAALYGVRAGTSPAAVAALSPWHVPPPSVVAAPAEALAGVEAGSGEIAAALAYLRETPAGPWLPALGREAHPPLPGRGVSVETASVPAARAKESRSVVRARVNGSAGPVRPPEPGSVKARVAALLAEGPGAEVDAIVEQLTAEGVRANRETVARYMRDLAVPDPAVAPASGSGR